MQDAGVPLDYETHGGEDVGIYAHGTMAHLFHGVHEQTYIAHAMMYAACIMDNDAPHCATGSGAVSIHMSALWMAIMGSTLMRLFFV